MWQENLYEPFEILIRERDVFPVDVHRHSFFELVHIVSGNGSLSAFGKTVAYKAGDLFLIRPETAHRFVIGDVSRFVFLRFTEQAITDYAASLAEPFFSIQTEPDPLSVCEEDAAKIRALFRMIWQEKAHPAPASSELLLQWSVGIVLIVARNRAGSGQVTPDMPSQERLAFLLPYIQRHIRQPEKLKADALAAAFDFSRHYLGRYFKRHYQENLGDYVARCRIRAIQNALAHSTSGIKQIAWQFGFTDASHLTRFFRRRTGQTPRRFRLDCRAARARETA